MCNMFNTITYTHAGDQNAAHNHLHIHILLGSQARLEHSQEVQSRGHAT